MAPPAASNQEAAIAARARVKRGIFVIAIKLAKLNIKEITRGRIVKAGVSARESNASKHVINEIRNIISALLIIMKQIRNEN